MRDLVTGEPLSLDGERVDAVGRAVRHEQRAAVRGERNLRGVTSGTEWTNRPLRLEELVALDGEASEVRFAARVEDVDASAVDSHAARRGPARPHAVERNEVLTVDPKQRHVVAPGIRHKEMGAVQHDRPL